jgi:hypothetical protein
MPSQFGWVDFSERDRQRILNTVNLFRMQDTRDELGIGSIRDAFADHFFPGTSTIQTRAKYMLFIPWVYLDLERKKVSSSEIAQRARNLEVRIIKSLLDNGETEGVIGKEVGKDLVRLPSSIYWAGLGHWGIRIFPGSQEEYHRRLDQFYLQGSLRKDRAFEEGESRPSMENWHPGLPENSGNYIEKAHLTLSRKEAEYLYERILMRHTDSLLAKILQHSQDSLKVDFLWEHSGLPSYTPRLQEEILQARNFSQAIHGAALIYNYLLAKARSSEDWSKKYEGKFLEWTGNLTSRWEDLSYWFAHIQDFWNSYPLLPARLTPPTKTFVNEWLHQIFDYSNPETLYKRPEVINLIIDRETYLKKGRARLKNPEALKNWGGDSGSQPLNFRWGNASVIINDILEGLAQEAENA